MAEAVTGSIARKIVANLVPQALENVGNLWAVKHELEVLRDTVSTLLAVLDHAEEQYYQSHQIRYWLDKLKDAFYDAQDVLEELNIEAMRREPRGHNEMMKEVRTFFSSSNQLILELKMNYKVRALRESIEDIKAERNFQLEERGVDLQVEREWGKREEMHSFIIEGNIIGRDDDKKTVMKFLLDLKEDVSILPIVGMGGIGKTALAQYVYNDEMVTKHFDVKMWVCVSRDFDMKKIVKDMIACAKKKEPTGVVMEQLQSEFRGEIKGKRYLLVLDDLWDAEQETWLSLKYLLLNGARGSKIVITTRNPSVAAIVNVPSPHFLSGLHDSESLDLLIQMAGRKIEDINKDRNMKAIANEIIEKCSGVPLIVRTVGNLLFFKKTEPEWLHFKDHELLQVSQMERLEAIKADRGFLSDERNKDLQVEREWRKREETDFFICEGGIMGRDDDKQVVMEFLLDSDVKDDVSILPIVGICGLGKTALAHCVYNDERVGEHFKLKMWVCVSDGFDKEKIVKKIICAKKEEPTEVVMERLECDGTVGK